MNKVTSPKNISEVFSRVLFVTFYVLLLVEFFAIVHNSSAQLLTLLVIAAFLLLTLFNSYWGLWLFVATIPFLNGFSMLKGFGDISLVFVGVYLAWLPQQLLRNKSLRSTTVPTLFANLLAVIVLLNLGLVLVRIVDGPIPSRFWADWFSYFPFVNQADNLWQINAALILLKGIFLFRMVELELRDRHAWIVFTRTIYVQAIIIAGFSLFHWVLLITKGVDYLRPRETFLKLYLPFNDIHSYGSYVALLLVVFVFFFLHGIASRRVCNGSQSEGNPGKAHLVFSRFDVSKLTGFFCKWLSRTVVNGVLAFVFFVFCFYSFSRMTWLAAGIILFLSVMAVIRNKRKIICFGIVIVLAFIAGNLAAPQMIQSENPSLYRLGSFFNIQKINKDKDLVIRYELWERSWGMVKEYPLTGVGMGNFYRNNVLYENSYFDQRYIKRYWGKGHLDNAHNYFLQLAAELGIPGVLLFIVLLFSLYFGQITSVSGKIDCLRQEISVKPFLYGLGAYLLTLLTGHPLLLSSQQFLFWAIVALIAKGQVLASQYNEIAPAEHNIFKRVGFLIFFLFVLGFSVNLSKQEPWTIPSEYGLYSSEKWEGTNMRWMAGKAQYYLPETTKTLDLKVVAQPFNSQAPDGLTLTVSINNLVVDTIHFVEGGTKILNYDVSSVNEQKIKVNLEVNKVFIPKKIGLNDDFRELGVALGFER